MKVGFGISGEPFAYAETAPVMVYVAPDEAERRDLSGPMGIDPYDLDSALDPDEIPRLELTADHLSLLWKRPRRATIADTLRFEVSSLGLFLRPDRLVVVLSEEPESLTYYLNAIEGNGGVLLRLRNLAERLQLTPSQIATLDDLILENTQCARQAQIYSTVLAGLMDARGTIVNNNMNILLKNLTLINIIFLPLNLIAGIGGMSEYRMMTSGMDWRLAYALFTLGMILLGWVTSVLVVRATGPRPIRRRSRLWWRVARLS